MKNRRRRTHDEATPPRRLLSRGDQLVVALMTGAALCASIFWWISRGGMRDGLIQLEQAPPEHIAFQVDVNEADWPELIQIPGIGTTLASRIVESRQTEGPYRSVEDLARIRGIGPKTLERIRPYIAPLQADPGLVDSDSAKTSPAG